ncbi:protein PAXX isoform X3 [Marmota monax]|uniref:protein PAXX isoform X3 n=2 Tax=Marmota monax TaxID=9995 RepID=UPI001EB0649D|nr:protein PAXX isoform X3 [Marmota monax]
MVPPPLSPPLCTLPPGPGPPRFVCYCEREESGDADCGGFNLYVTDAAQLWSTSFSRDSLAALKARFGLSETEDITSRFRGAINSGLRPLQGAGYRGSPQVAGTDPGPGRARVQPGAATGSCGKDSCQPQEESPASGISTLLTRPRSPERWSWTWGQETVSRGIPHQPWLQKKPAGGVDFDET